MEKDQRRPFVAIDEAVVERHGLGQCGGLARNGSIIAAIRTLKRRLNQINAGNAGAAAEAERPFVGAQCVGKSKSIVSISAWQGASKRPYRSTLLHPLP